MLDKDKLQELLKIATKASEKMIKFGYPDFSLTGIKWDEEENEWSTLLQDGKQGINTCANFS